MVYGTSEDRPVLGSAKIGGRDAYTACALGLIGALADDLMLRVPIVSHRGTARLESLPGISQSARGLLRPDQFVRCDG